MRTIESVVFKGGGVLGMAYAGAIEALEEQGILQKVQRSAGTSAGSVVALMVALGYNSAEIKKVVNETNFNDFEDHWNPLRVATKYGLYKGDFLLKWIQGIVAEKADKNITYGEMKAKGFKELKVFATNLNTQLAQEFSAEETPDVKLAESVRASMSIPLFFAAWQFPHGKPNNHIYVDGGVLYNYPINAYDLDTTLGFFLHDKHDLSGSDLEYDHLLNYVGSLFQTLLKAQEIDFEASEEETEVSILIDDFGISATNFSIDDEQKTKLFNSGKEATLNYIQKNKAGQS
ncbi:patatin-like phospholipase family protein [Aureisphaera galaxeae]|uniref:patatin-like phospholipase family protein n=1 Tax=Aureisphaera galaxeae TaxID=1538023 RepID=UPI00235060EC|nr:patatin-like phospholipase family protein [Aureisphaera galaxeae]MDC8005266.1 patatin-like phospholipase family protein [Aureisphaera galaxeae]